MNTILQNGGLSLIHPYYNDERRLRLQFDIWSTWPEIACKNIDITLVDDGSPEPLILNKERQNFLKSRGIHLSVYRILVNKKWNTPGALNLGVTVAPKPWVLFMDTDCFFDYVNIEKVLNIEHDDFVISKFNRKRYCKTEPPNIANNTRFLPCTMLMHKQVFWNVGGFDEDFTFDGSGGGYGLFDTFFDVCSSRGGHWSDYEYLDEVNGVKNPHHHVYKDIIAGEWMPSYCGDPVAVRNDALALPIAKKLYYNKKRGIVPQNRQILNFPWKKVYDSKYPTVA